MKAKLFWGPPASVIVAFNQWAKGKALSRDVIIHSFTGPSADLQAGGADLYIIVYHPEDKSWDKTEIAPALVPGQPHEGEKSIVEAMNEL